MQMTTTVTTVVLMTFWWDVKHAEQNCDCM